MKPDVFLLCAGKCYKLQGKGFDVFAQQEVLAVFS